MGKDMDFFLSIKSGHVLYCIVFLTSRLLPFESIREKNGNIKLTEKFAILQYTNGLKVLLYSKVCLCVFFVL